MLARQHARPPACSPANTPARQPSGAQAATAIDSDKSFDVAILEQVIRATYFSPDGRGRPSLAAKHPDLFRSSAYYSQHEKEVPEAMVGMACAGISEAIRRWSTGEYKRIDISTTAAEDQYRTCIDVLQAIHENSPECYHRVLHRLYLGATGGMSQMQAHSSNKQVALRNIRFADSDDKVTLASSSHGATSATGSVGPPTVIVSAASISEPTAVDLSAATSTSTASTTNPGPTHLAAAAAAVIPTTTRADF